MGLAPAAGAARLGRRRGRRAVLTRPVRTGRRDERSGGGGSGLAARLELAAPSLARPRPGPRPGPCVCGRGRAVARGQRGDPRRDGVRGAVRNRTARGRGRGRGAARVLASADRARHWGARLGERNVGGRRWSRGLQRTPVHRAGDGRARPALVASGNGRPTRSRRRSTRVRVDGETEQRPALRGRARAARCPIWGRPVAAVCSSRYRVRADRGALLAEGLPGDSRRRPGLVALQSVHARPRSHCLERLVAVHPGDVAAARSACNRRGARLAFCVAIPTRRLLGAAQPHRVQPVLRHPSAPPRALCEPPGCLHPLGARHGELVSAVSDRLRRRGAVDHGGSAPT